MKVIWYILVIIAGVIMGVILNDAFLRSYIEGKRVLYCLLNGFTYFLLILFRGASAENLIYGLMASILLMISIIDYHFYEIPVKFNYYLVILGIIYSCVDYKNWFGHLAGFFCVSSFLCLLFLLSNGKLMGGGDVKLMAACGLLLGWKNIFTAFYVGCVLTVLGYFLGMRGNGEEHVVAMGPYFSTGILLIILWNS